MPVTLPPISMPAHAAKSGKKFRWWLWLPIAVIAVFLISTAAIEYTVAKPQGIFQKYLIASPWPAGWVGWHPVWYQSYDKNLKTLDHYINALKTQSPTLALPTTEDERRTTALTKVIRDQEVLRIVDERKIKITAADIDQAYTTQLTQGGDATTVANSIKELYGWTPAQFKANVLKTYLARQKIQEALSYDDKENAIQKKQVENVLGLIKAGKETFEDLAKKYSEDSYASTGGDVGFVNKGDQVKAIDDATFALAVGQVSEIIHTQYGFHILKVTEKKTVSGVDQAHLLEITISAPSPDTYITNLLKKLSVRVWLPGLHWDAAAGNVVVDKPSAATNTAPTSVNAVNTNATNTSTK